jgi:hypothetical protein
MDERMEMPLDDRDVLENGNGNGNGNSNGEGQARRILAAAHACACNPMKKDHCPNTWYDTLVSHDYLPTYLPIYVYLSILTQSPGRELLSEVFAGRWVALPYVYNVLKTLRMEGVYDCIWRDGEVKAVHYIFGMNGMRMSVRGMFPGMMRLWFGGGGLIRRGRGWD